MIFVTRIGSLSWIMLTVILTLMVMEFYHDTTIGVVYGFTPKGTTIATTAKSLLSRRIRTTTTSLNVRQEGRNPTSFEGTDLTITEYPHPVLRRLGDEIHEFDDELQELTKQMITIMYAASGVGLAAPQINRSELLFVYNPTGDPDRKDLERIVINPKILEYSETVEIEEEGCLSSRSGECAGLVCRSKEIMVEYQNEKGGKVRKRLKDFEARVFQHEYDHVMGILHFDRFCPEDREKIQRQLDLLIKQHDPDSNGNPVLVPNQERFQNLQPAPLLRRGWMPPIAEAAALSLSNKKKKNKKNKKKAGKRGGGGGFGGGGFG